MALDPVTAALDLGGKLIDKFFPDKAQADAAKLQLLQMQQAGELTLVTAQTDVNKVEAASTSTFVAGWRPYVGWVCGTALAYAALLDPLMRFVAQVGFAYKGTFPVIDTSLMLQVLLGMLGMGALRSWDKKNDAANGH